jgi:hypothetical protein
LEFFLLRKDWYEELVVTEFRHSGDYFLLFAVPNLLLVSKFSDIKNVFRATYRTKGNVVIHTLSAFFLWFWSLILRRYVWH